MEFEMGITKKRKIRFSHIISENGAMIAFFVLFLINALTTRNFFNLATVKNILNQSTTTIILSLGMTVVIATGGINISIGSMMAFSAMVAAKIILGGQLTLGIVSGLLVAVIFGIIIGYIIIKFDVQPMIASLTFLFMLRGFTKLLNDGKNLTYKNKAFSNFFYINVFDEIPMRVIIWLLLAILLWILLSKTQFGKYVEAFGDNPTATKISGINTMSLIIFCYVICSGFAAIAGIAEAGFIATVDPGNMGVTKEMDAIAATVLGGTLITGGKPKVWGTVWGSMLLQLITIMVNMNNVSSSYSRVLKAIIIIMAVYAQTLGKKQNS
jgi:ribose transport system permease protein